MDPAPIRRFDADQSKVKLARPNRRGCQPVGQVPRNGQGAGLLPGTYEVRDDRRALRPSGLEVGKYLPNGNADLGGGAGEQIPCEARILR